MFVVPSQETSHLHEFAQLTEPQDESEPDPEPTQVAEHSPRPQLSVPQAALPPEQSVRQRPVVQLMPPHALLPVHVASQLPLVHEIVPHAALPPPPEQSAVQSPLVQPMLPHAFCPTHSTVQSLVWQVMPRQALSAVQWMSHDCACVQLIVPHAPVEPQLMMQFQPGGHARLPLPVPVIVHVVVWKSHVPPQIAGHTAASRGGASSSGFLPITQ